MVDLVIIGHNLRAGISRAEAVSAEMRDKTIIVWVARPTTQSDYVRKGFRHFCSRDTVVGKITEIVTAEQSK
jgi:hypothetical protein